jgi:hypothetical protein
VSPQTSTHPMQSRLVRVPHAAGFRRITASSGRTATSLIRPMPEKIDVRSRSWAESVITERQLHHDGRRPAPRKDSPLKAPSLIAASFLAVGLSIRQGTPWGLWVAIAAAGVAASIWRGRLLAGLAVGESG